MHVSQIADRYVKDPNDVVKVGQKVQVTVQNVDLARGRIALTMKKEPKPADASPNNASSKASSNKVVSNKPVAKPFVPTKGAVAPNGIRFK